MSNFAIISGLQKNINKQKIILLAITVDKLPAVLLQLEYNY